MAFPQIEYTNDVDAITIRIPKGLSEGKPIESDQEACLRERQAMGKILYAIHRGKATT